VGRGWKLSYETELYAVGRTLQVVQADGTRIIFSRDPRDPSQCASADPAHGTIDIVKGAHGDEYVWHWTNGRELRFDTRGHLTQIPAPGGQFVSLQHDSAGLLVKVTDPQGRSLNLTYLDKASARAGDAFRGVQTITSPVGKFTYHYGSPMPQGAQIDKQLLLANLVRVDMPTGSRYYHYEDARFPTLLTGISELVTDAGHHLAWQRVSTYGYDANGKGNLSVRGRPAALARDAHGAILRPARLVAGTGIDQVTLDFSKGGQTTVTNERGQATVFRHAVIGGEYRLLEVRGPGCANCGPSNVRYRYDARGRLAETTTLDAAGTPLAGMRTDFDARGRPASVSRIDYAGGRPGAPQWQTRYEYAGAATQPARVLRPSVVAGKQAIVTITYAETGAAAGKPMSVREDGFVPSTDPHQPAAAITRTVDYRYAANGEVARIDGPLANASLDATAANSDITRIDFDPATKLPVRIVHPGNRMEEVLQRDAALRPRVVRISDGDRVRTVTLALNWRGQPEQVEIAGAPPVRHRYDVNGRRLDADDVPAPDIQPALAAALAGTTVDRDPESRPVAWHDAGGAVAVRTDWGAPGTAAQASLLAISAGSARAERLLDDFGRVVAIRNPDQGWQVAQHDAAGRIVDSIDPRGARQHAEWDAGGRLLKLVRYAPGASVAEHTVTYRYTGSLPRELDIADADGTRITRNEFDPQGRLVAQTLTITPSTRIAAALAEPVTLRHGWRYDARGRLVARTFTDGAGATFELREDSDAQGRTTRIATHGVLPGALGGGRVIAAAIGWDVLSTGPFAGRIAHGDGSVDEFDVTPTPGAADAPRFLEASLDMGDGSMARRSPGRDTDAAGLPAAITTATADQHLAWDAAGRLARAVRADGNTHYVYDAQGQRVARIVTDAQGRAAATLFFHHDHQLVAETDAQGRMRYAYAYLGWRPLAQLDLRDGSWWSTLRRWLFGAPVRHLHTDRAGKVTDMTQDGKTIWRDRDGQEPSLRRVASVSFAGVHQPLRYVGQYHDDESGLVYHGARYFDPGSGRFLSPDPAGIADATSGVPAPLLLDLYAYAGGRPDEFFDPDGAARIRYFAITTGANGRAIGTTSGFVRARWAFIVDNIRAGIATSALGQKQNEYAQNGTGLLVDVNGDFFSRGTVSATWTGSASQESAFTQHYGTNLISIPAFTIEMNDADATTLIASYIQADRQALFPNACPARNTLLPQIRFAPEEVPINVTSATMPAPVNAGQVLAQSQRIVECGNAAANDLVTRRLEKYNYATMLLESSPSQIGKDCSSDGCPGHNLINTVLPNYVASYGQTQFIGTTLVETLRRLHDSTNLLGAPARAALRLDDAALWNEVDTAFDQAKYMEEEFDHHPATTPDWAAATQAQRNEFAAGTGLSGTAAETVWNDLNRWKRNPTRSFNGEARAAFATTVLMATPNVRNYLMGIFKDSARGGRFYTVSLALMRESYNSVRGRVDQTNNYAPTLPDGQPNPAWATRQRQIEIELAVRTGRAHNGDYNGAARRGTFAAVLAADSSPTRGRQYGRRLVNAFEYPVVQPSNPRQQQPTGDYFALRCTADLPSNVPKGGIQINPLNLH
jgi:RHS repeat-associated protein